MVRTFRRIDPITRSKYGFCQGDFGADLRKLAKQTGRRKSDLIRDALRRQIPISRFDELRKSVAPFAEARGWLTDEDLLRTVLAEHELVASVFILREFERVLNDKL